MAAGDSSDPDSVRQDHLGIDIRVPGARQSEHDDRADPGMSAADLLAVLCSQLDLAHSERVEGEHSISSDQDVGRDVSRPFQCRLLEPLGRRLAGRARRSLEPIDRLKKPAIGFDLFPVRCTHSRVVTEREASHTRGWSETVDMRFVVP